jgi:hypothetical protein
MVGETIGQVALGQGPDFFVGIGFRRLEGEVLDVKSGMPALESRQRFSMVRPPDPGEFRLSRV